MKNTLIQIENYFSKLHFNEEKHLYTVDGKILPSVSKLIDNFVEKFKSKEISNSISIRTGVPQKDILKEWKDIADEACDRGHRVHNFGELYPYDKTLKPSCNQEKAVVKFWNDLPPHIVPVKMELRMYHKALHFAGTADIILYNTITKEYIIADYKTNKDLFKNFKEKKLLGIFSNLLDCPLNKYQIQLSFYQILLEQLGFKVSQRKIIWLLKTGEYQLYDTEDLTPKLNQYLISKN